MAQIGSSGAHIVGGTGQAPALSLRHRLRRIDHRAPRLDLNDHQCVAAAGENVDFADRRTNVATQDQVAAQPQGKRTSGLGKAAALPVAPPLIARSRD